VLLQEYHMPGKFFVNKSHYHSRTPGSRRGKGSFRQSPQPHKKMLPNRNNDTSCSDITLSDGTLVDTIKKFRDISVNDIDNYVQKVGKIDVDLKDKVLNNNDKSFAVEERELLNELSTLPILRDIKLNSDMYDLECEVTNKISKLRELVPIEEDVADYIEKRKDERTLEHIRRIAIPLNEMEGLGEASKEISLTNSLLQNTVTHSSLLVDAKKSQSLAEVSGEILKHNATLVNDISNANLSIKKSYLKGLNSSIEKNVYESLLKENELLSSSQELDHSILLAKKKKLENDVVDFSFLDDSVITKRKMALHNEAKFLKETREDRATIAIEKWTEENQRVNGPVEKKEIRLEPITFEVYSVVLQQYLVEDGVISYYKTNKLCKTSVSLSPSERLKLTVNLVPVPFFIKEDRETMVRFVLRNLLKVFYYSSIDFEVSGHLVDKEHDMPFIPSDQFYQDARLNRKLDKSKVISLAKNFRFLGFESDFIRSIFVSRNDFLIKNGLNKMIVLDVHPLIYQSALNVSLGKTITQTYVNQLLSDYRAWYEKLPPDVVVDSVSAGCQAAAFIASLKDNAFRKVEVVIKDV